jgi:hypothetical protein
MFVVGTALVHRAAASHRCSFLDLLQRVKGFDCFNQLLLSACRDDRVGFGSSGNGTVFPDAFFRAGD